MKHKVVIDASVLAISLFNKRARTGIFRVVENLILGLQASEEIDLQLTTPNSKMHALSLRDFLDRQSNLRYIQTLPKTNSSGLLVNVSKKSELLRKVIFKSDDIIRTKSYRSAWLESLGKISPQIFHSPHQGIPDELYSGSLKQTKKFFTCYDLIPIKFPQYFPDIGNNPVEKAISSLKPDTWISCISESTRNDFLNYRSDFDERRVHVAPLAASALFHPFDDKQVIDDILDHLRIPKMNPYLLSVCTLEPRKNLRHLINSFGKLIKQEKIADLNLVLVGAKGWDFDRIFQESGNVEIRDRVYFTGYIPDEYLAPIYSGSIAFVYPSLYEGFGLPPLEAMQCGVPVITSNNSSLPEVVGNAGIMVDPVEADELCDAILKVYDDVELRSRMSINSLSRAKMFTWNKFIEKTIAAYQFAID